MASASPQRQKQAMTPPNAQTQARQTDVWKKPSLQLPRVVQGCRWCRLRAGTGISPEADEPCRRIEAALTANELLLTGRNRNNDQQTNAEGAKLAGAAGSNGGNLPALATVFEIMRAVNGTAYYVKETFAGVFDSDR